MRIFASLLFFFLSFVLFTSCTILILSYPKFTHSLAVKGVSANNKKQQARLMPKRLIVANPTMTPRPTPIQSGPKPIAKPTQVPTPTSTSKPILTATESNSASPVPTSTANIVSAKVIETPVSSSSFINQINAYRASNGLSAVSTNSETCNFASIRAVEIASDFSHSGFTNRINNKSLPYSSYHEVAENIAMNSDSSQIVAMWINSPGHAENMRKDTPFVCVIQNGNYFAYEGWRP